MNNHIKSIITSTICAILVVLCYHNFVPRQTTVINQAPIVKQVHNKSSSYEKIATQAEFVESAETSQSSVVLIKAYKNDRSNFINKKISKTTGSGVIVSSTGHIVTNSHVIDDADDINITLNNSREYKAKLIAKDGDTDLAVLKIDALDVSPIQFSNSDDVKIAEWVMAIGNPFELQSSVTAGIVSAKTRDIGFMSTSQVESFIQTDAAANSGNSGGALINMRGQLIGIITAIMTEDGSYDGASFAIPSNIVHKVVSDIIQYGSVQRAWMGVNCINVTSTIADNNSLTTVRGVQIITTHKDGSARKSGVKKGDILLEMNGQIVQNKAHFTELMALQKPGNKVNLKILRNKKEIAIQTTLQNRLNTTELLSVRKDGILSDLGLEIRELQQKELSRLGQNGIFVSSILRGSKIYHTHMEPSFIITTLNGTPISDINHFVALLSKAEGSITLSGFYEYDPGKFDYVFTK